MSDRSESCAPEALGPLDELLSTAAGRHRDLPAVWDGDLALSHGELDELIAIRAEELSGAGAGPGRVVAIRCPNSAATILALRASWRIGAAAFPIHPAATERTVASLLDRVAPAMVVDPGAEQTDLAITLTPSDEGPSLPDGTALLLATSGSTGEPKIAMHTQSSLAAKAGQMPGVHGLGADDVVLMPAPMSHMSGVLNGVLVPGAAGMACVPMARWDPAHALELIEAHGVSFMVGPPTFFVSMLAEASFAPERVASLRLVSSGGASVTPSFVAEASERLGAVVKRTYGSTEAPTIATADATDDPHRLATHDGHVIGDAELVVLDPGGDRRLGPGEVGELAVRGPELFAGYLGVPADQTFDAHGWFRTGDLGRVDADGWLTVTGRLADLVIRGGENIAVAEIEVALEEHPRVSSVGVVGVADAVLGEAVAAAVVTDDPSFDLAEARVWLDRRGLDRHKRPDQLVLVDALPLLSSGKLDRAAICALFTPNVSRRGTEAVPDRDQNTLSAD